MEFDYGTFHKKINDSCILLIDNERICTLCDAQLPFQSQYNSHTNGQFHYKKVNNIVEQLMDAVLSPGVTVWDDGIYCDLCNVKFAEFFDWKFRDHINSSIHKKKLFQESSKQEENEIHLFYHDPEQLEYYDDIFIEKMSKAAIVVDGEGRTVCTPCESFLPGWQQFTTHINGACHKEMTVDQLCRIIDKVGLSLGIVLIDGFFYCELCNDNIGSSLMSPREHASKYWHKCEVEKQIQGGLYEYDCNDDDDDYDDEFSDSDDFSDSYDSYDSSDSSY